jgi:hypothetical protein
MGQFEIRIQVQAFVLLRLLLIEIIQGDANVYKGLVKDSRF